MALPTAGRIGTTPENLLAAANGELEEHSQLYPGFADVAAQEGFNEIAQASNEQSQGLGQVVTSVSQMDEVTQANAASAEESAAAAEELHAQSQVMDAAVKDLRRLIDGKKATQQFGASAPTSEPEHKNPPAEKTHQPKQEAKKAPAPVVAKPAATPRSKSTAHADFFK